MDLNILEHLGGGLKHPNLKFGFSNWVEYFLDSIPTRLDWKTVHHIECHSSFSCYWLGPSYEGLKSIFLFSFLLFTNWIAQCQCPFGLGLLDWNPQTPTVETTSHLFIITIVYHRCRWAWWSSPPTSQGRRGAWKSCISWCKTGRGRKSFPFSTTWIRAMFGAQARGPWRKGGPRRPAASPPSPRTSIRPPSRPLPTLWAGSIPAADTCKKHCNSFYTRVFKLKCLEEFSFIWVDLAPIAVKLLPLECHGLWCSCWV